MGQDRDPNRSPHRSQGMHRIRSTGITAGALALAFALPPPALAGEASVPVLAVEIELDADIAAIVRGADKGLSRADYAGISANISLENAIGWTGARLFAQAIAATGGEPNAHARTLEGVNNIEVIDARVRLFQLYLEQDLPLLGGSLRVGLSDLNEDFYATAASDLLIAPPFGIGSELSATGRAGPSIFPSTAPAARLRMSAGNDLYLQAAAYNAEAGTLGDSGGIRPLFRDGALLIGEVGRAGAGKLAVGAWRYSKKQDDVRATEPDGKPLGRVAQGVYALVEQPLGETVTLFARAGLSDGRTSPFRGGWQAGFVAAGIFTGRDDSALSFGLHQGFLSRGYRRNAADDGAPLGKTETGVELTFADRVAPWLSLQPDVQYVWTADRGRHSRDALIFTLRLQAAVSWP